MVMKKRVSLRIHTAQVFLLEEWYEADKEGKKRRVRRMDD